MDGEPKTGDPSSKLNITSKLKWLKAGLSLFIVYQLTVVVLAPNAENYVGKSLQPAIEPYINFFELTNRWSFFAPEPGPPPVFIEYELLSQAGESIRVARFPEEKSPFLLRDRQNRRIAATEFMIPAEDRIEKVMVPYLCNNHPEVSSVKLWRVAYQIPTIEDVVQGKRKIGDDINLERRVVSHTFCERKS